MGLFRKLAEVAFEFPEEDKPKQDAASQEDDVVAAIEKIRLDLEQSGSTDFSSTTSPTPEPAPEASAAAPRDAAGLVPAATRHIPLPKCLSIPEIYQQAKVPETELSIYRVEEMLNDPEIADLDPAMRARMVRMTLKNLGVELNDILKDAGHRDKALGAYQNFLGEILNGIADQINNTNAEIQREIDSFIQRHQDVIDKNNAKLKVLNDSLAEFNRSKEAEEERLFNIAAPFVGQGPNPVDIGDAPQPKE